MRRGMLLGVLLLTLLTNVHASETSLIGRWVSIYIPAPNSDQIEKSELDIEFQEDGTFTTETKLFHHGENRPQIGESGGTWRIEPGDKAVKAGFDGAAILTNNELPDWKTSRCSYKLTATTLDFSFCYLRGSPFHRKK